MFHLHTVKKVHPQNVRFQNGRFQNVQNVRFTKHQVYITSGLHNVRSSKRPVVKRAVSKRHFVNLTFCKPDVLKPYVLKPDVLKPYVLKPDVL